MDYRVLTEAERKYTFSQSQQLSMQTGLIGYLRADFGSNGNEFWTTWNDFRKDLKTDDFKKEFDLVINSYRFGDGEFLSGRSTMSKFCYEHPESSYEDDRNHYGVRVDTERYSYLMPCCSDCGFSVWYLLFRRGFRHGNVNADSRSGNQSGI